jgi:hypothetical protein
MTIQRSRILPGPAAESYQIAGYRCAKLPSAAAAGSCATRPSACPSGECRAGTAIGHRAALPSAATGPCLRSTNALQAGARLVSQPPAIRSSAGERGDMRALVILFLRCHRRLRRPSVCTIIRSCTDDGENLLSMAVCTRLRSRPSAVAMRPVKNSAKKRPCGARALAGRGPCFVSGPTGAAGARRPTLPASRH